MNNRKLGLYSQLISLHSSAQWVFYLQIIKDRILVILSFHLSIFIVSTADMSQTSSNQHLSIMYQTFKCYLSCKIWRERNLRFTNTFTYFIQVCVIFYAYNYWGSFHGQKKTPTPDQAIKIIVNKVTIQPFHKNLLIWWMRWPDGICLKESKGIRLWRDPRKLIHIQASPPPRSTEVHLKEQKVRQKYQETCMDEQEASGKIKRQKWSM